MIEFTLVSIAVVVVMATKWEIASRWQMRVGGLLSLALGVRVAAMVTATYLFPCFASILLADEPVAAVAADPTAADTKPADDKAAVEKAADVKPADDKAAVEKAADVKPAGEKPMGEKPADEKVVSEKPADEKRAGEKAADEKPADDKSAVTAEPTAPANEKSTPTPVEAADVASSENATAPAAVNSDRAAPDPVQQTPKLGTEPKVVPLEEAFHSKIVYLTPNRPEWLESVPAYEGELYKVAVRAGPYQTVRQCLPDLDREVTSVVNEFINDHLRAPHASTFISYSPKELRSRKVVREQFSEQLDTSVGLMSQVHAHMVFDDQFRNELDQRWSEIKSKSRLAQTGLGTGIVLLFLGTMFSFLKLDTVTRGYYTGRLQFVASATILALVAASVLLMKWIPWM